MKTKMLTLATLFLTTGCASNPLFKEWDFSVRPDYAETDAYFKRQMERVKEYEKETDILMPSLKHAVSDDVLLCDFTEENGIKRMICR